MLAHFGGVDLSVGFPLVDNDLILVYSWVARAHEFLDLSGRFWGYDPFMGAGYISGPILGVGTHLVSLLTYVVSGIVPLEISLLWIEIMGRSLAPLAVVLAVRNFGGTSRQGWMAFGLMICLYGLSYALYLGRAFFFFEIGVMMAIWQVSLYWKWTFNQRWGNWLSYTLLSIILFQIHPSVFLIIIIPSLFIFMHRSYPLGVKHLALVGTTVGLVWIFNWYWIYPFFSFISWYQVVPYGISRGLSGLARIFLINEFHFWGFMKPLVFVYLFSMSIESLVQMMRKSRFQGFMWVTWMIFLFVVGYFGSNIPFFENIQPSRFIIPFYVLMACLIAIHVTSYWSMKNWRLWVSVGFMVLFAIWPQNTFFKLTYGSSKRLTNVMPPFVLALESYLRKLPPQPGRIMLENRDSGWPHFSGYLPVTTGKAFMGENAPSTHIKTGFSGFSYKNPLIPVPVVFRQPLESIGEDRFRDYLSLYNVSMILALSPQSTDLLKRFDRTLSYKGIVGNHALFDVNDDFGWFKSGSGEVDFSLDKIVLTNLSEGQLIIKFHWLKTFKADPPVSLKPVKLMDDPLPFIEIDNAAGHNRIVIYNAGL
jgi:hypothetical protein